MMLFPKRVQIAFENGTTILADAPIINKVMAKIRLFPEGFQRSCAGGEAIL